jgi:hypothetical protein
MIIDVHCHHTFTRLRAGVTDRFSFEPAPTADAPPDRPRPTDYDSCVSDRALRRPAWRIARWGLRLPPPAEARPASVPDGWTELDRALAQRYEAHLFATGPIERFVLLAFDAVHDDEGRCPPLPVPGDPFGSDIYTSNSLIRDLCRRFPQRFLFGASVHPYRRDAVQCVEEVFAAGACLLKWIPLHHNIDFADPRTVTVLRKCAALGLPLLVHCGDEYSLVTQRPQYRSVRPLLAALRVLRRQDALPCVIVAHAATPVPPLGDRDSHRALLEALRGEFADAPLYSDIAALTAWPKVGYLRRLLRMPELHAHLLFGTDFPVPTGLRRLRRDLGQNYARLAAIRSWPQRAAAACRVLGFNEIVFHRAAELLPNVDYFARRACVAAAPACGDASA